MILINHYVIGIPFKNPCGEKVLEIRHIDNSPKNHFRKNMKSIM